VADAPGAQSGLRRRKDFAEVVKKASILSRLFYGPPIQSKINVPTMDTLIFSGLWLGEVKEI
jgi:hypothetical protein